MSTFDDLIYHALGQRRVDHLLRSRKLLHHLDAVHHQLDGKKLVNFSSNNYLGLTHHPRLLNKLKEVDSTGAGAAGLISGYSQIHQDAEVAIARWKQTEASLLMPSGYQANLAAIQTLHLLADSNDRPIRFIVDKLVHASLIDAIRQTHTDFRVFPHNNIEKLERLLSESKSGELQVVVTESIFSMDGDAADLKSIAALKKQYDFVLLVDEAHGSGVYGEGGCGLVGEMGLRDSVDISIVTLSKALGIAGGAICGGKNFIEAVTNFGRAYIYSTGVTPLIAHLAIEAISVIADEPQRQTRVRELSKQFRETLSTNGFELTPGDSPIIPIMMHEEQRALSEADRLREEGILVVAVRPPTVPKGTSRLRVTLSYAHSDIEVAALVQALRG